MPTRPLSSPSSSSILALLGAIAFGGCTTAPPSRESGGTLVRMQRVEPFDTAFALVDSIVLEQRPDAPIVRVSGLARRDDGVLALADVSEGNVKLFEPDGRLRRIIGRKGKGPGEFVSPRYLVFRPDGGLIVVDGQLGRLSQFSSSGELETTLPLDAGFPIQSFHVLPDGRYVVSAPSSRKGHMLHLVDTAGRTVDGFISNRQTRPRIEPDLESWGYLAGVSFAGDGHRLAVAFSLSDSLWLVDASTGTSSAMRLVVPGYVEPTPPTSPIRSPQDMSAWADKFHTTSKVMLSRQLLLVPFVQGVLNYGDPLILAVRTADSAWRAFDQAPPPVFVSGDTVFTLLHTQESPRMVLGLHALRR